MMDLRERNVQTMLAVFQAVAQRDEQRMRELCVPDVEFHWPPSLPYGRQVGGFTRRGVTWGEVWGPLQPTKTEQALDPRLVAASESEVVVHWTQRGLSPSGERFEGEVLGLYCLQNGKLVRAQMFYFDTTAVAEFLARAGGGGAKAEVRRE